MIIGVDLDDTINNLAEQFLHYAKKYNKENKIDYKIIETEWDFDKAYGWSLEDEKRFFKKYIKVLVEKATIKENAAQFIKKLREEGNKIFIITARSVESHKDMYAITEKWLKQNNVEYDKLIIESQDKAEKCLQNNVNIFIDDRTI